MRVITGKNRGLKLISPGVGVRPTLSRVKEAIFSSIGEEIVGKIFLDVFCGTGQMGIEAISRGASFAVFIDIDVEIAKKNLEKIKLGNFKLIKKDLLKNKEIITADIAYIDPPYNMNLDFLKYIHVNDFLILEQDKRTEVRLPANLEIIKEKSYAHTTIYFLKKFP
ncbi:MAG: RsmD family RNA methyltransferase [Defluviitaleaceae bacterium]|nr:RsmD family RNA methyltransferase [Defluviitaleaceae bacterium]